VFYQRIRVSIFLRREVQQNIFQRHSARRFVQKS
jgi:hypothetical protein